MTPQQVEQIEQSLHVGMDVMQACWRAHVAIANYSAAMRNDAAIYSRIMSARSAGALRMLMEIDKAATGSSQTGDWRAASHKLDLIQRGVPAQSEVTRPALAISHTISEEYDLSELPAEAVSTLLQLLHGNV